MTAKRLYAWPRDSLTELLNVNLGAERNGLAIAWLTAGFALSRVVANAAGVHFDATPLTWFWQFIDGGLLKDRLFESLLYSHAQPPLFNLMLGINLELFPARTEMVMQLEFFAMGLLTTLGIFTLLVQFRLSAWLSATLATLFSVTPAMLLFENWLFYEYPTMTLLIWTAVALHRFLTRESARAGFLFFSLAAGLICTRAAFQVGWLIVVVGALLLVRRARLVCKSCALPILVVGLLYVKNLALFGVPTTSSWAGMNLARATVLQLDPITRRRLVDAGTLHAVSLIRPFSPAGAYLAAVPPVMPTGIPLLDQTAKANGVPNFHAKAYVQISRDYLTDALWVIRNDFRTYARSVKDAAVLFLSSSSGCKFVDANRQQISAYDRFVNNYVYLQSPRLHNIGLGILATYLFVAGTGAHALVVIARRRARPTPALLTLLFISFTCAYIGAVSCMAELGENQRMRFCIDPLAYVVVAAGLSSMLRTLANRRLQIAAAAGKLAGPVIAPQGSHIPNDEMASEPLRSHAGTSPSQADDAR